MDSFIFHMKERAVNRVVITGSRRQFQDIRDEGWGSHIQGLGLMLRVYSQEVQFGVQV